MPDGMYGTYKPDSMIGRNYMNRLFDSYDYAANHDCRVTTETIKEFMMVEVSKEHDGITLHSSYPLAVEAIDMLPNVIIRGVEDLELYIKKH
jgi:hypothetical protein